jgi:hypothetical protein
MGRRGALDVTAIESTKNILKEWPKFQVVTDFRGAWIIVAW